MTATMNRRKTAELIVSTPEETRRAVQHALAQVGLTYAQLQVQADSGQFDSVAARLTWVAVRDLGEFAH